MKVGIEQDWTEVNGYWGWATGLWNRDCPVLPLCMLFFTGNKNRVFFLLGLSFWSSLTFAFLLYLGTNQCAVRSKCKRERRAPFGRMTCSSGVPGDLRLGQLCNLTIFHFTLCY